MRKRNVRLIVRLPNTLKIYGWILSSSFARKLIEYKNYETLKKHHDEEHAFFGFVTLLQGIKKHVYQESERDC